MHITSRSNPQRIRLALPGANSKTHSRKQLAVTVTVTDRISFEDTPPAHGRGWSQRELREIKRIRVACGNQFYVELAFGESDEGDPRLSGSRKTRELYSTSPGLIVATSSQGLVAPNYKRPPPLQPQLTWR